MFLSGLAKFINITRLMFREGSGLRLGQALFGMMRPLRLLNRNGLL